MRHLLASLAVFGLASAMPTKAHAQLGPLTAVIAGVALDKFADRLEGIVGQATRSGDFLLEKNARLLQGVVADARVQLEEVLDKKVGQLKLEHRNFLATLDTVVDELKDTPKRVLELQDFLALDLENLAKQLPALGVKVEIGLGQEKPETLSFRRLDGYSQIYQKDGVYTFRMIGAAFGPDFRSTATVNGTKVKLFDMRTPRKYVLEFDVPVQVLNAKFAESSVERVDMHVESYRDGKEKPAFVYKNQILLLPKSPVLVKVSERYKAKEWSRETYTSSEGSAAMPRLGHYPKNDKDYVAVDVKTSIPAGCLILKDTVAVRFEPQVVVDWSGKIGGPRFSDEDRVVSQSYRHNLEKHDCTVYVTVNYRKPVEVTRDRPVAVAGKTDGSGAIPFGTTILDFSREYESFTATAKWFNGREATLTPTQLAQAGLRAKLETSAPPRLLIDVSWPDAGNK